MDKCKGNKARKGGAKREANQHSAMFAKTTPLHSTPPNNSVAKVRLDKERSDELTMLAL